MGRAPGEAKPQVWPGGGTKRPGTAPPPALSTPRSPPPALSAFSGAKPQNVRNGPLGRCHLSPGPQPTSTPTPTPPPHGRWGRIALVGKGMKKIRPREYQMGSED